MPTLKYETITLPKDTEQVKRFIDGDITEMPFYKLFSLVTKIENSHTVLTYLLDKLIISEKFFNFNDRRWQLHTLSPLNKIILMQYIAQHYDIGTSIILNIKGEECNWEQFLDSAQSRHQHDTKANAKQKAIKRLEPIEEERPEDFEEDLEDFEEDPQDSTKILFRLLEQHQQHPLRDSTLRSAIEYTTNAQRYGINFLHKNEAGDTLCALALQSKIPEIADSVIPTELSKIRHIIETKEKLFYLLNKSTRSQKEQDEAKRLAKEADNLGIDFFSRNQYGITLYTLALRSNIPEIEILAQTKQEEATECCKRNINAILESDSNFTVVRRYPDLNKKEDKNTRIGRLLAQYQTINPEAQESELK